MIIVDLITENHASRFSACQEMANALIVAKSKSDKIVQEALSAFSEEEIDAFLPMAQTFADIDRRLANA